MAENEDFRRWEAKRRDVKRAEIRLSHGLRSLEGARLACLNSMTREQRQLRQELEKLQKSHLKQKLPLGTGRIGINMTLPLLSHQTRWDTSPREAAQRSTRKAKPGSLSDTNLSPSHPHSNDVSGCEEDGKEHLPPLKAKDQAPVADSEVTALKNTVAKQLNISEESAQGEEPDSKNEQLSGLTTEETRDAGSKNPITKPMYLPGKRRLSLVHDKVILDPEAYAPDGRLRTMYFRPSFPKLYAEARKFRYIRHRHIPVWEKELSLQEIFGHKTPTNHSLQPQTLIKPKS